MSSIKNRVPNKNVKKKEGKKIGLHYFLGRKARRGRRKIIHFQTAEENTLSDRR